MLRQFLSGSKAVLKNKAIVNGQILFPNDASEIYYDINGVRRTVQGVFYVENDIDLTGIASPEERLYFSHGSNRVFAYDANTQEFTQVNRTGVVNNLTSAQRLALTSCAEDSIYIDSDTLEMYVGTNMSSNSLSASMFGNVYWHKIGESISNYNGLVSIRTNDKNVLSTDISGNTVIGDNSNSCSINTLNLKLNGNSQNSANGLAVLDNSGKIPASILPDTSNSSVQSIPFMEKINSASIVPEHQKVYCKTLEDSDSFEFSSPQNSNCVLSFRLYLAMPSTQISFTFPTNIIWESIPDFTTANSLYMLVFEWNPVVKKWLGNQMWNPISLEGISLDDNSNSSSGAGGDTSGSNSGSQTAVTGYRVSAFTDATSVNGDYLPHDEYNGQPRYLYDTGDPVSGGFYLLCVTTGTSLKWAITPVVATSYYYAYSTEFPANNVPTPDSLTWVADSSNEFHSAPTVTAITSGGSNSGVPSYRTTNTPGVAAAAGTYAWDETNQVWSNGSYYMKDNSSGGTCMMWIYPIGSSGGVSTGTYGYSSLSATGNETPANVLWYTNNSGTNPGIAPAPTFEVVS